MNQEAFWEWAELQAKAMHAQSKALRLHSICFGIVIALLLIDLWKGC